MDGMKKKLAFLLSTSPYLDVVDGRSYEKAAEDLIANGVTFATDTKVGDKWTPTDERLPEHGDVVLCQHKHFVCPFIFQWDKKHNVWLDDEREYGADYITHWMPLPEPPKN